MKTIRQQAIEAMALGMHQHTAKEKHVLETIKNTIEQSNHHLYQLNQHITKQALHLTLYAQAAPTVSLRDTYASLASQLDKQLITLNQVNATVKNDMNKKAEPELELSSPRHKF